LRSLDCERCHHGKVKSCRKNLYAFRGISIEALDLAMMERFIVRAMVTHKDLR